jgi:glyoxylase-like metal-dependent hydrolase (beta-lactamase superfamily II)
MPRLELSAVTPRVLCVRRPRYLSNSYIVHDDAGVVLVDAGMEADGSDMLAGLREIGRDLRDVTAILLTHWHNDHSSGAEALRQATNATVYYHRNEHPNFSKTAVVGLRAKIADVIPETGVFAAVKAVLGESPPRAIERAHFVADGDIVESRFRVIETPGHSAGHVSFFYEPDRVLFAGDALAVCGGRLWFMSRFLTESIAAARESMRTCVDVEADAICPGHRGPLSAGMASHRATLRQYLQSGKPWPLVS